MKYISEEKFIKKLKRDGIVSGVASCIIGAMTIGVFALMGFDTKDYVFLIFGLILGGVFIGAGIYFFKRPYIMMKRSREMDDPESRIYQKTQMKLDREKNKILETCENHKSLRYILCFRAAMIRFVATFIMMIMTFLSLVTPILNISMIIICFVSLMSAIRSVTGKNYRLILKGYEVHGMNRQEAENDFAGTKAYIKDCEVISVSRDIFLATAEKVVLSVPSIVWVFAGYTKHYNFERKGIHSYIQRTHHICIGLENGNMFQISCPEKLCSLIINDIIHEGKCVTSGYSEEMKSLYITNPENFRYAVKPISGVQDDPVNCSLVPE